MHRIAALLLEFAPDLNQLSRKKQVRDGLSGIIQTGADLWVVSDEALSLERLSPDGCEGVIYRYGRHAQFPLGDFIRLPAPDPEEGKKPEEADLEGLAYGDGYLWLVGSHSLKRGNPGEDKSTDKNLERLETIIRDGNRCVLGRIPLIERDGHRVPVRTTADGKRSAAILKGDETGNELIAALREDPQLAPFLEIPGKENGFDVEGIAAVGTRIFLGLRGPVLRGWAVVLEIAPVAHDDNPAELTLRKLDPGDHYPYRKHFLDLNGLGIRDLCADGSDLLILAGPSMDIDGPTGIFRWKDGAARTEPGLVFADALEPVVDLPYGLGLDHPEGLTRFSLPGAETSYLLVVYDSPHDARLAGDSGVMADVFAPAGKT